MRKLVGIYFLWGFSAIAFCQDVSNIKLPLGTFNKSELPKEMYGCGGSYFRSMTDRKLTSYIGVDDGAYGFFKIGNKLEKFTQIQYISIVPQKKWKVIYQNKSKSIRLTIEVKNQKSTGDENGFITGIMTFETNGKKITIPFVGDNGC